MAEELLRTFGQNTKIETNQISDAVDKLPLTHEYGTVDQNDYAVTPSQLQQMTIVNCSTAGATNAKVGTFVGGLKFTGTDCIGRNILVKFTNAHTGGTPTFSFGGCTGTIKCINQVSTVNVGAGFCTAGSSMILTWDGTDWILHSNIAKNTGGEITYADGTTVYNKHSVDQLLKNKQDTIISLIIGGNTSAYVDLSDLANGIFLLVANNIYSSSTKYTVGVLHKYGTSMEYTVFVNHGGFTVSVEGLKLKASAGYIYGLRLLRMGY